MYFDYKKPIKKSPLYPVGKYLSNFLAPFVYDLSCFGQENIPLEGPLIIACNHISFSDPAVIIANHMSLLETAVLHAVMRPRIDFTFVIKRSLLNVKYFGDIMRSLEAIPVDRVNPRDDFKAVLTEGKERLSRGKCVVLFPQATRSETFIPANFNTIGIKLAKSAGVPVLPLALKTDFLGNGKLIRDMGPVRRKHEVYFEFAEPEMVTNSGKELHEKIIAFIQDRLNTWYAAEGRTPPQP